MRTYNARWNAPVMLLAGWSMCVAASAAPSPPRVTLWVNETASLTLKADFRPIDGSMYRFHEKWDELRDFKVARDEHSYGGKDFRAFLPPHAVAVGDTWALPSEGLLPFLRQFHPGATLDLHLNNGDSPGAFGCLRAAGDEYAEIAFRIHCEFVLKRGWLTPGQMTGRLVIDRRTGDVVHFHMYLPPAPVNFDTGMKVTIEGNAVFNAFGDELVSTDAGSIPKMELVGGRRPADAGWTAQLAEGDAAHRLASRFYRYKQVHMVDFAGALGEARRTGKPLHAVMVEGALDDESC